jgi:uncharacterized protein YegL
MAKSKKNEPEKELSPHEAALEAERRIEEALAKRSKEFSRSFENRTLISIAMDTSGSMHASGAIEQAKGGMDNLIKSILAEDLLRLSVELHFSVFAETAATVRKFGPIDDSSAKSLFAELPNVGGGTAIANAAQHLMDEVESHQRDLRQAGQNIRFSIAFLITDGLDFDTEGLKKAGARIRSAEAKGGFRFIPIGVDNADLKQLGLLAPEPLRLSSTNFRNFFRWLIPMSRGFSQSQIGEKIAVPDFVKSEENPDGWAERYGSMG